MKPTIIVHGGAGNIEEEMHTNHLRGLRSAAAAGWDTLSEGGSALDAVERAVSVMEDDPAFNAGVGSALNRAGDIETDAMIMDGRTLAVGAVAAVRGITNPIKLARLIAKDTDHCLLVGEGARSFAERKGMRLCAAAELTVPREVERFHRLQQTPEQQLVVDFPPDKHGTVGAVAVDAKGNVAAATSTGGMAFKLPGRVGDSPLVGSGAYADNLTGAASATGHGEKIMRVVLCKTATDAIARGMGAQEAAEFAVKTMHERVGGYGGLILVDYRGQTAFAYNTPHMSVAWVDEHGEVHARVKT